MNIINSYRFGGSAYSSDKSFYFNEGGLANEHLNCGNVLDEDASNAFSFSAWIKLEAASTIYTICNKRTGNNGICFYVDSSERLNFQLRTTSLGTLTLRANSAQIMSLSTWYHVAFATNGDKTAAGADLWTNGVSNWAATNNNLTGNTSNSADFKIGIDHTSNYELRGKLFALEKWNTNLSGAEVTELYNSGTPIDPETHSAAANLDAVWRFGNVDGDDATGTTGVIQDTVGGFDGTPINTVAGDIVTDAP